MTKAKFPTPLLVVASSHMQYMQVRLCAEWHDDVQDMKIKQDVQDVLIYGHVYFVPGYSFAVGSTTERFPEFGEFHDFVK